MNRLVTKVSCWQSEPTNREGYVSRIATASAHLPFGLDRDASPPGH